jgi:hypothetical protein
MRPVCPAAPIDSHVAIAASSSDGPESLLWSGVAPLSCAPESAVVLAGGDALDELHAATSENAKKAVRMK